jgi:hypothetical protein
MGEFESRRSSMPIVARTGESAEARIDVGLLIAHSPRSDPGPLQAFGERMIEDSLPELAAATDVGWRVHAGEPDPLGDGASRRPSEFLDEAALRMVEGPYDLVVVVTDVPLTSRVEKRVPGLASPISRVVVVSTRRLLAPPGRDRLRSLGAEAVRWNAATLLLHLIGHVLGASHSDGGGIMEPFAFDRTRETVPSFDAGVRGHLRHGATRVPEDASSRGRVWRLGFHVSSLVRNPSKVLAALVHSRAPLLPLSLPKLLTAAVTPTLILVFSAETWDVGLNLTNGTAVLFATLSIIAATVHFTFTQHLTFPRERTQVITEHMALVNVTVFFIILLAMVGVFVLVGSIILLIELVVFPPNLMTNWPSLEDPSVGGVDLLRIAAFISSIGVLTGSLAGGIEDRIAVRHLALFLGRP